MVAFQKMWDDVNVILSKDEIKNIDIVEKFQSGFVVKDNDNTHFVTKDDFVDFWCNMLCYNEVEKGELLKGERSGLKYVYEIIKTLPYINENEGTLKITE
ncbi:hypothetical protein N4T77_12075 [Clostridium sp. CX1]|uniref:Uncharacterized protein n=1 Tax=Clostridium tanneri TaxID=3037988 RepID=A0ABU4JYG4_9CLOT|nr:MULTISPECIES: hypothetical protein [unclassified Clostridium]MCT8977338.1 hypothetical protein [Clostridium sp. CX1]MDW8802943.1 hypothetical protein [Clostridium sp. A1-XYC3]